MEWWQSAICSLTAAVGAWEALLSVATPRGKLLVWLTCPVVWPLVWLLPERSASVWDYAAEYGTAIISNMLLYSALAYWVSESLRRRLSPTAPGSADTSHT
jgi:hypothetical protein